MDGIDRINFLPDFNARRILVVEDDFEVADRMVASLRSVGYYVQNAYNVGDALAIDHARFDLAVVDGSMRDRDGVSLLKRISVHTSFSQLRLLVIGNPSEDDSRGDFVTLQRSFTDSELLYSVEHCFQTPSADSGTPRKTTRNLGQTKQPASQDKSTSPFRGKQFTENDIPTEPDRVTLDAKLQQQLAELRILSNLGRSISSVLELSEVLNQIVEAATTLTRAEEGLLLLPDPVGKALYLRAMKGLDDRSARNFRIQTEDPLVGRVFRSGEPILRSQHGPQRVKTEYFVQSLLYVPLTYKEQVIGVLGVNNRDTDRPFTQHDQELLLDLAAHAAVAIENAQLYEERLLQNRQLSLLVTAGKALNSTLSLREVLTILCQQMLQTVGVDECTISQQDDQTGDLIPVAAAKRMVWAAENAPRKSLDDFRSAGQMPDRGKIYVFRRGLDQQIDAADRIHDPFWAKQSLVVPLQGRTSSSASTISTQASSILELYYPRSALQPSEETTRVLRDFSMSIMTTFGKGVLRLSDDTLRSAQQILDLTGSPWLAFFSRSSQDIFLKILEIGSVSLLDDPPDEAHSIPHTVREFARNPMLDYSVHDPALPNETKALLAESGIESLLSIQLVVKARPFGAVTLSFLQPGKRFRPNEISLASALVTQAASALENAYLFSDLEDSLSELKETQASLVQAARLSTMGELAAVVAHQINNPLTTILADAEIILQDIDDQHPLREGITAIHRSGVRAHTVVKRLLSTARRDNSADAKRAINVHESIQHTLDLITTHIERSRTRIEVSLGDAQSAYTLAAPGHLEDLWLNLLLNARDALLNLPRALIRIEANRSEHTVAIRVCDNGPGLPPESMNRLFEPFFTTKPVGEGTGLGLYVCKQIVDGCRGAIFVETTPGKGACFCVTLPTVPERS